MDINATLIGQMITFSVFVWFTMKFVWPPLEKILKERQTQIAEGLAAAERGHHELEIAQKYAIQHIHEARSKANELIEQAKKQAIVILDEAKIDANKEREKMRLLGEEEIKQAVDAARNQIQSEMIELAVLSAEKLLGRTISTADQKILGDAQLQYPLKKH